jgi:hypothetical protein
MATLVAIGYPDQTTAEEARQTVASLEADLIIEADQVAAIRRDADGKYHVTTFTPKLFRYPPARQVIPHVNVDRLLSGARRRPPCISGITGRSCGSRRQACCLCIT